MKFRKIPKPLKQMVQEWHRLSAAVFGPPGSGKTTFIIALKKVLQSYNVPFIEIGVKEEVTVEVPESVVVRYFSDIARFTSRNFEVMPSIDLISADTTLEDIKRKVERLDYRVAQWVILRIEVLLRWRDGNIIRVRGHLNDFERRMALGLAYAARLSGDRRLVIVEDFAAFDQWAEQPLAVLRPFVVSVNKLPETRDMLMFRPVVIAPHQNPIHRWGAKDAYVLLNNGKPIEKIRFSEIRRLAES